MYPVFLGGIPKYSSRYIPYVGSWNPVHILKIERDSIVIRILKLEIILKYDTFYIIFFFDSSSSSSYPTN